MKERAVCGRARRMAASAAMLQVVLEEQQLFIVEDFMLESKSNT